MRLSTLAFELARLYGPDREIAGLALDSRTVRPGDLFVDVGANAGSYTNQWDTILHSIHPSQGILKSNSDFASFMLAL